MHDTLIPNVTSIVILISALMWRAPELMRTLQSTSRGSQKGDVYAFGIILFEILGREGPWGSPEPCLKCESIYAELS